MPLSRFASTPSLDQRVVVKKVDLAGTQQLSGKQSRRRVTCELLEFGDSLPVVGVLKKLFFVTVRVIGERAGLRQIACDTSLDQSTPLRAEDVTQANNAVLAERINLFDIQRE